MQNFYQKIYNEINDSLNQTDYESLNKISKFLKKQKIKIKK